jgi:hypothetical protein
MEIFAAFLVRSKKTTTRENPVTMKQGVLLLYAAFIYLQAYSQDLPTNPTTGNISITDSVDLKGKKVEQVKEIMMSWGHTLLDGDNIKQVYKLDESRQTESIYINLPVGTILTQDRGNGIFYTNGTLSYIRAKTNGINPFANSASIGGVKFSLIYKVTSTIVIFEFTNLEYSSDGVHYGRFESDKAPQSNYGASVFLGTSKKEWNRIRLEYFNNLKILAGYLKQYATPLLAQ